MLNDPEFLAAAARAQEEINARMRSELCRHGERAYDDRGTPTPCPKCREAGQERSEGFWDKAKDYMDGVKKKDEVFGTTSGPQNTNFTETPGFDAPEPQKSEKA